MRDTTAPHRKPLHPRPSRKPASVVYPQVLLFVQAGCWALATVAGLTAYIEALGNGLPLGLRFEQPAWLALAGGLAAEAMLGLRVGRIRSRRTWKSVIATELAMTCFGMPWLLVPALGSSCSAFPVPSSHWLPSCA